MYGIPTSIHTFPWTILSHHIQPVYTLCSKKFAPKDPTQAHVTKTHSVKIYADIILENAAIPEDLIVKHATLLTRD